MTAPETTGEIVLVGRVEDPSGRAFVASIVTRGETKLVRLEVRDVDGSIRKLIDIQGPRLRAIIALLELADALRKPARPAGASATFTGIRPTFGGGS